MLFRSLGPGNLGDIITVSYYSCRPLFDIDNNPFYPLMTEELAVGSIFCANYYRFNHGIDYTLYGQQIQPYTGSVNISCSGLCTTPSAPCNDCVLYRFSKSLLADGGIEYTNCSGQRIYIRPLPNQNICGCRTPAPTVYGDASWLIISNSCG